MASIFDLFKAVTDAVRSGDFRSACSAAGQLLTVLTASDTVQSTVATTTPTDSIYQTKAQEFCSELSDHIGRNEVLVKTGVASDTTISPAVWSKLFDLITEVIKRFIPKTTDIQASNQPQVAPATSAV